MAGRSSFELYKRLDVLIDDVLGTDIITVLFVALQTVARIIVK